MDVAVNRRAFLPMLLVGLAYYVGAWLSVHYTITPEGIAILWLPNAILLPAFLMLPYRQWPLLALAALLAEIAADLPSFPLWAALAFGLVNLFEVSLAAILIRQLVRTRFGFDRMRNGAYFLVFGPLLASALAALAGAGVYLLLGRADTGYMTLWLLWWLGDALGLLLLTPFIVEAWRWLERGMPRVRWPVMIEWLLLLGLVLALGLNVFEQAGPSGKEFLFRPVLLVPLGILAALRLGILGAMATVMLIAALAVWHLVRGIHPYATSMPQQAVWLTQEYLALIALVTVGLAILLREIADQRETLKEKERALAGYNEVLEERVRRRTRALEQANWALRQANEQLATMAATDELTGIANRRHLHSEAQRELARLGQDGETASAIMVDLDRFKAINDQYGHEAGDQVLRSVLEPMSQCMRPWDLVGRIGGEEFLILLSDVDQAGAAGIAERIREAIEVLDIESHGRHISITASFGIAQWDGQCGLDELIRHADEALYRAKRSGRNRVECH